MPYVMVPVPEELVEDVMQFIIRAIAKASIEPWDKESVDQLFTEVDEASRSLLAFVARAAVDGEELAASEAAAKLQLNVRESSGIMNELNVIARDQNRPLLINSRTVPERLPNGRVTEKRVFQMEPEVAELVRDAEQADLQRAGDPLGGAAQ